MNINKIRILSLLTKLFSAFDISLNDAIRDVCIIFSDDKNNKLIKDRQSIVKLLNSVIYINEQFNDSEIYCSDEEHKLQLISICSVLIDAEFDDLDLFDKIKLLSDYCSVDLRYIRSCLL